MAKLANKNVSSRCCTNIISSAFYYVMVCNTLNSNFTTAVGLARRYS